MLIVLALLLFAVAGVAVYVIAADGTGEMPLDSFGLDTEIPVWAVFVAGAVTMLVLLAAVAALAAGLRAARARRTEIRYLRQKVANQDLADDRSAVDDRPATMPAAGGPGRTGGGAAGGGGAADGVAGAGTGAGATDTPAGEDNGTGRLGRWRRRRTDDSDTGQSTSNVSARP